MSVIWRFSRTSRVAESGDRHRALLRVAADMTLGMPSDGDEDRRRAAEAAIFRAFEIGERNVERLADAGARAVRSLAR